MRGIPSRAATATLLAGLLFLSLLALPLPVGAATVYESDQTWAGDTAVSASQRLTLRGCTLTVVDGNITVYGSLTLENARIAFQSTSPSANLTVSGEGRLTLSNATIVSGPPAFYLYSDGNSTVTVTDSCSDYQSRHLVCAALGGSKVEIIRSCLRSMECGDYSRVGINDSTIVSDISIPIDEVSLLGHGHSGVRIHNSLCYAKMLVEDSSELSVVNSTAIEIECRGSSKTMVAASTLGHASVRDDSTLYLEGIGILGMMIDVDAYRSSVYGPRLHIYNCLLGAVRVWGDGRSELNIAHSTIGEVQTLGQTKLTYDSMTVTGEWTHNGEMLWECREHDRAGNFRIEWGGTNSSGMIISGTAGKVEKVDTAFGTPPAPIPQTLSGLSTYVYSSYRGGLQAQVRIHYTDDQVAALEPSTLRLYSYTPEKGWQQLNATGVNETAKYVWGNVTNDGGLFSACFAALGSPKASGQPPTLAGGTDWWAMAPYIVALAIAVAVAGAAVYYRRPKVGK